MVAKANSNSPVQRRNIASRMRAMSVALLIFMSVLFTGTYVLVHWLEHQILDTDSWVALVSPLPKQPVVSTALGNYIGQQTASEAELQKKITDALPPKAAFLSAPLAGQVQSVITRTSQKIVASDGFQTVWVGANRVAMGRLLAQARGQPTPLQSKLGERFNININGTSDQLRTALSGKSQALPAAVQSHANKALAVSVDLHARAQRLHQIIRALDFLAAVLPFAIIASLSGALALAVRRRRTVIIAIFSLIVLLLLQLVGLKWMKQTTLDQVHNSANIPAVEYIYNAVVSTLRHAINVLLVIMAVIAAGLMVAEWRPTWIQSFISRMHVEAIQDSRIMATLHSAREWIRHREYYLWAAAVVLVLIQMALLTSTITSQWLISYSLLLVSICALIHIAATSHSYYRNQA
jgi:hypothetical protein